LGLKATVVSPESAESAALVGLRIDELLKFSPAQGFVTVSTVFWVDRGLGYAVRKVDMYEAGPPPKPIRSWQMTDFVEVDEGLWLATKASDQFWTKDRTAIAHTDYYEVQELKVNEPEDPGRPGEQPDGSEAEDAGE
jgi:hypothetical protein